MKNDSPAEKCSTVCQLSKLTETLCSAELHQNLSHLITDLTLALE